MEQAQLQLVFNVVAITGVTSLASFCYLLKKENRNLATGLQREVKQEDRDATVGVVPATVPAGPGRISPTTSTATVAEQDIRTFAADQRTRWVEGMRRRHTTIGAVNR
jgi:hypothetical protein